MKGSEFVRRSQARGIEVEWIPERGKGSHGLLYLGNRVTVVRNLKDEMDRGAFHGMLKQLGLTPRDIF